MQDSKNVVIQPGGLSTDTSLVNQPQNMTRFVLNGVNETVDGDRGFIANEESNEPCYTLPSGFTPIGKVYIGNDETLIFLCSSTGNSILAIVDRECNLTIQVDDSTQEEKLGFRIDQQIDATFRLRRGCERTVYWVDPKPRVYIIEKPEKFQDDLGNWDVSKFSLSKKYEKIPNIDNIEVLNGGGILPSGSYNVSVQYLDEDLNPTEFTMSTETVYVYNSDFTLPFRDIRGSTNVVTPYQNFGASDKSIRITVSNLDTSFPFYRFAITEATSGNGTVTDTKYTAELSTQNNVFTYTGANYESIGSSSEVLLFNNIIEEAETIEQLENRLLLGNVKGKDINYCNLQKYASRIAADMVTRQVSLSSLVSGNSKHPSFHFDGAGYMPGEIYSFAIVYIFDDMTVTPGFHIPGKSNTLSSQAMFNPGTGVYPMSTNNTSADNRYIDNESCNGSNYWGTDSEGTNLNNQLVRHHRFPLRTDVNLPLIEKIDSNSTTNTFKRISANIQGTIPTPVTCEEGEVGCTPVVANLFQYQVTYHKDADVTTKYVFNGQVDPADYASDLSSYTINETDLSNSILATTVTFLYIDESQEDGTIIRLTASIVGGVMTANSATGDKLDSSGNPTGVIVPGRDLDYTITLSTEVDETTQDEYVANIFGIQFSNIEVPSETELNGNKIVGYYIVRNERTEEEKTILDSAVLFSTTQHDNFVASGLLMPQNTPVDKNIKKDIFSIINPEFKFNSKKYKNFTKVLQQGRFTRTEAIHSRTKIIDVVDGNSYQDRHKDAENSRFQGNGKNGPDGFMLQIKTRDNIVDFVNENDFEFGDADIKEIFYLPALENKGILDSNDVGVNVYNLACDNQVGILSVNDEVTFPITNSVPYVYFIRDNANPYNNFRLTPYYKENQNPIYFEPDTLSTCSIFNGDSYITPMKYTNSLFHDNRLRLRAGKTSAWNYVGAALLVVVAVAISIFTFGAGTAVSALLIGTATSIAAAAVGMAATLVASGIKQDTWVKTYGELYNKGLRETIQDEYVLNDKDPDNNEERGFHKNPPDDEIQWLGESLNLWFESAVNMNLRQGASDNTPDFLNAPGLRQDGVNYPEWDEEYFGIHSVGSREIPPTTALDIHMVKKLTYLDNERKGGRAYFGLAAAEVYQLNLDYTRRNKEKIFNHLPLEYDCCSDCNETFPHRVHYSEQSFQEELTDNFRTFLPNNYRDIEGETGVITDMFRIQNNLYIHTEEALWHQPQNFQERVTDQVVSFIGTGEYFSIPPRKIVDDSNSSAGNIHKWARIKTRFGVLFPSHKEKKWYIFDAQKLQPITDNFNSSYFKEAMSFKVIEDYYTSNKIEYPYDNNPSNSIGVGYLSVYDTKKERLIISKKDFVINNLPTEDYQICNEGSDVIIFEDITETIEAESVDGWSYIGMQDCKLKFQRTVNEIRTETRYEEVSIFKDIDYLVFKYNFNALTGGTDLDTRTKLLIPTIVGPMGFGGVNTANDYLYWSGDNTGTGLESVMLDVKKIKQDFPSATEIVFNSAAWWYVNNPDGGIMNMDAEAYTGGTMSLVGFLFTNTGGVLQGTYSFEDKFIPEAPTGGAGVPEGAANQIGDFTYTIANGDLSWDGASGGSTPPATVLVPIEVEVSYPVIEYKYVEGVPFVPQLTNNSWTMSYSLKDTKWISWHSYLPSFYLYVQEKFYSWKEGLTSIWRHGKENHYQTFYGELHPFIVEYVDNSNALVTKIYDAIKFQTEAKQFDVINNSYTDKRYITFNKILAYNTHQISGFMNMVVKQEDLDYMSDQIINTETDIIIDRKERDWNINDLRDLSVDTNVPMFNKNLTDLQAAYFIDKIVNGDRIDYSKDWTEMESFSDKFLVVRLIFDTFDNTRLLMNFSIQDSKISER